MVAEGAVVGGAAAVAAAAAAAEAVVSAEPAAVKPVAFSSWAKRTSRLLAMLFSFSSRPTTKFVDCSRPSWNSARASPMVTRRFASMSRAAADTSARDLSKCATKAVSRAAWPAVALSKTSAVWSLTCRSSSSAASRRAAWSSKVPTAFCHVTRSSCCCRQRSRTSLLSAVMSMAPPMSFSWTRSAARIRLARGAEAAGMAITVRVNWCLQYCSGSENQLRYHQQTNSYSNKTCEHTYRGRIESTCNPRYC